MIQYPDKPWTDKQKFTFNGVCYEYDEANNCWKFSPLTYKRLYPSIEFLIPGSFSSVRIEISSDMLFTEMYRVYDSSVPEDRTRMVLFSTTQNEFCTMASEFVKSSEYKTLILIPEIDLSKRYYCRYRWTSQNGSHGEWKPIILPAGHSDSNSYGGSNARIVIRQGGVEKGSFNLNQSADRTIDLDGGHGDVDLTDIENRLTAIEQYLAGVEPSLHTLASDLGGGVN